MATYPPSPVFSDCDSLASDELDALLEAQGELSHWPTPPLSEWGEDGTVTLEHDMIEELDCKYARTVNHLTSNERRHSPRTGLCWRMSCQRG